MVNLHSDDKRAVLVLGYLRWLADTNRPALQRVVDAEYWCRGAWKSIDSRNLIGHAADYVETPQFTGFRAPSALLFHGFRKGVEIAFDSLCHDYGIAAVVAAIQAEAGRLLEAMPPSERAATRTALQLRELAEVA